MSGQNHDEPAGADGDVRSPRDGVDPEVLEFAQMLFQLARDGETEHQQGVAPLVGEVRAHPGVDIRREPLGLAAYNGHPDTVRALLQRGAEVDRANDRGQTPLAGAVFKGYGEVVRALFEAGADPYGGTPTAVDTARMFEKDAFLELFGV